MGRGEWIDPKNGAITLTSWVNSWLPAQSLTLGARQQYGYLFATFILSEFGDRTLTSLTYADHEIAAWEQRIRSAYAASTARQARGRLENVLEDAVQRHLMVRNPARRTRGRGSIEERRNQKTPRNEGQWATPTTVLLIAERMALLAGRDDEFIMGIVCAYQGLRLGEVFGLERDALTLTKLRIDWQLYELNNGSTVRKAPKDGSRRVLDCPPHVAALLRRQLRRLPQMETNADPCGCVKMRGDDSESRRYRETYGHPASVHLFRGRRGAPHWRRDGLRTWIFDPAVEGWYPQKKPSPARPVPLHADGATGVPLRGGRNLAQRSTASWLPLAPGMTPHGLRHSAKTWMLEDDIHRVLQDERLGHIDSSVQGAYSHVTRGMRERLVWALGQRWETSLKDRARMWPSSHVAVLDELLEPYRHLYRRYLPVTTAPSKIITQCLPTDSTRARPAEQMTGS